ncbi:methyltransferase domain-containing protein [Massilia dura]|uniref:Methyltransferase domain-containing protein n=1 Tax=Pseudoduganella dura TaxID=321982 RepID=A0A6I3XC27_9BURK|nr:methyltransferase domain-containing protein [Pseudoduganella dura]MUI11643.1 methyltransferase domain-containing protein [Pseudoduganella dura]GGX77988.1 spermidine synthase [Pseudoduganella dura]
MAPILDQTSREPVLLSRRNGRLTLEFVPGEVQSQMDLADPHRLVLAYARAMMCFVLFKPRPAHIVMVGLGGGSLAKFCHRYLPHARITVLELSAEVIALREHFAVPPDSERFRVIHADAARHMPRLANSADVLLVDGFDASGLPPALGSARFYADCRRALRPDGLLVANIFSYDPNYPAIARRLRQAFGDNVCQLRGVAGNNHIVFALRPAEGMPARAATRAQRLVQRIALCGALWPGLAPFNRLLAHWVVARLRAG